MLIESARVQTAVLPLIDLNVIYARMLMTAVRGTWSRCLWLALQSVYSRISNPTSARPASSFQIRLFGSVTLFTTFDDRVPVWIRLG